MHQPWLQGLVKSRGRFYSDNTSQCHPLLCCDKDLFLRERLGNTLLLSAGQSRKILSSAQAEQEPPDYSAPHSQKSLIVQKTQPIRKIHSWGGSLGEILLSSAGQGRKSWRQPKPSKSHHTNRPLIHWFLILQIIS